MNLTKESIDEDISKIKESMANLQNQSNRLSQEMMRVQKALTAFQGKLEYALEIQRRMKTEKK